ncbi:hypothetical protein Cgig2_008556 [Carnegiea gigantea]|uniref:Uncharacterized protein n=1 Tax=Carnegiea gigantea TaxID=171969 RepID=A0A9Q1GYH4_9CARY|nr:hypothetical protein Cgig2_008556 [Carnegiea gigantea]
MGALPFITIINPHRGFLTFPHSRSASEMGQYVIRNFEWDRRRVAFPLSPLPNAFQALCPSYDLAMAEGVSRYFKLSELPQTIFYAMLLSEVERLGVLHRRTLHIMESALTELRYSTFESRERERTAVIEVGKRSMSSFPNFLDTTQAAEYPLREFSPLRPKLLPLNFHGLCPNFDHLMVMQFAHTCHIPKMVQATFYAIVLNEAAELGLLSRVAMDRMMLDL